MKVSVYVNTIMSLLKQFIKVKYIIKISIVSKNIHYYQYIFKIIYFICYPISVTQETQRSISVSLYCIPVNDVCLNY